MVARDHPGHEHRPCLRNPPDGQGELDGVFGDIGDKVVDQQMMESGHAPARGGTREGPARGSPTMPEAGAGGLATQEAVGSYNRN